MTNETRPRHPNDTVQVLLWWGECLILVLREGREGGSCWELPGGSYQLVEMGLDPIRAALATLEYETGIEVADYRAHLLWEESPWNSLNTSKNQAAGARAYYVEIGLSSYEPLPVSGGARSWRAFSRAELSDSALRVDLWAFAGIGWHALRHGGLPRS